MTEERKEYYIELIKSSFSIAEVCKKANISKTTGNYNTIKDLIKKENIDITHFKRNSFSDSENKKITLEEILNGKECKITSFRLKNLLTKNGLKECKCEICKNTQWNNKPIPLELHHIDGNNRNNSIENLQILCPNCHTQTNNFGGKNIKKEKRYCKCCGKELNSNKSVFCSISCRNKFLYNKEIGEVTKEKLLEALNTSFTVEEASKKIERNPRNLRRIAKFYNIIVRKELKEKCDINIFIDKLKQTDSLPETLKFFGITRKWLRSRGFPTKKQELLTYHILH